MQQLDLSAEREISDAADAQPRELVARSVHPQAALWMVRAALGAAVGSAVFAVVPGGGMQAAVPQERAVLQIARSESVAAASSASLPPAKAMGQSVRGATEALDRSVVQTVALDQPTSSRERSAVQGRGQLVKVKPRGRGGVHRSHRRPLTAIARGANRTFRSVGRTIARLF